MIRLQRIGRRNEPHFRVVLTEKQRGPKSGNFIEILGSYNPKLGNIQLKADRIKHWISKGAQTSDTVHNFLINEKIIEGKKINVLPRKTPIKKEVEEEAEESKKEVFDKKEEETKEEVIEEETEGVKEEVVEEKVEEKAEEFKEEVVEEKANTVDEKK